MADGSPEVPRRTYRGALPTRLSCEGGQGLRTFTRFGWRRPHRDPLDDPAPGPAPYPHQRRSLGSTCSAGRCGNRMGRRSAVLRSVPRHLSRLGSAAAVSGSVLLSRYLTVERLSVPTGFCQRSVQKDALDAHSLLGRPTGRHRVPTGFAPRASARAPIAPTDDVSRRHRWGTSRRYRRVFDRFLASVRHACSVEVQRQRVSQRPASVGSVGLMKANVSGPSVLS